MHEQVFGRWLASPLVLKQSSADMDSEIGIFRMRSLGLSCMFVLMEPKPMPDSGARFCKGFRLGAVDSTEPSRSGLRSCGHGAEFDWVSV